MFIDFTNTDFENGRNINKLKLKKLFMNIRVFDYLILIELQKTNTTWYKDTHIRDKETTFHEQPRRVSNLAQRFIIRWRINRSGYGTPNRGGGSSLGSPIYAIYSV